MLAPSRIHRLRRVAHGRDNVRIGAATAQIAGHIFADARVRDGPAFVNTGDSRHDLTRRAVSALEGIVADERLLYRVQAAVDRQTLDRGNRQPFDLGRKRQASEDAPSIDVNRAGAALALIAPLLGTVEMRVFSQRIQQRDPRLDLQQMLGAVDAKPDPCARDG